MSLCGFAFGIGVAGAVIAVLSVLDLLRHVEGLLRGLLSLIRERLTRLQHSALQGGRNLIYGTVLLAAAFAVALGIAYLAVFLATDSRVSSLYFTPRYGLYALLPGALGAMALTLFKPLREITAAAFRSERYFPAAVAAYVLFYYIAVVMALCMPFVFLEYAGYRVVPGFVFFMLVWPGALFLPCLIAAGWMYLVWSLLGIISGLVLVFFHVFRVLASHPRGAIGLASSLMSLFGFGVRYLGICA